MHPDLGNDAAPNTGFKQPVEESKTKPKVHGSARTQGPREQEQKQMVKYKQAGQGTELPYAPSLLDALLTTFPTIPTLPTLPTPTFPAVLDTQALLDFNSQAAWAEFNSLFPTQTFNPGPFYPFVNPGLANQQQAGATVEESLGFSLNNKSAFNPYAAAATAAAAAASFDPSALPQVQVNTTMDSIPHSAQPAVEVDDKATAIPLICLLCPKKPTFSDVSHLLTHVSSKSHLAAEFKLKHSKKVEDQTTLVQYAQWAQDYGVNDLVANRIAAKEQKRAPKRQRVANSEHMKKKPRSNMKNEVVNNVQAQLQNVLPRPNSSTWHLHTPRDSSFDDPYNTPTSNKFLGAYQFSDSPQSSTYVKQETPRSGTEVVDATFLPETIDLANNEISVTRLKGTIYPGMSIFDAATEDQRRKRNQKKQPSVLQNMVLTSESVEQYECVWDGDMSEITRTRNVYDSPSIDGSPDDKDEVPLIGRKRRGRRAIVAQPGPRRQTRASTRAAGKRSAFGSRKKALQTEDDFDSDNDAGTSLRTHGRDLFEGDVDDVGNVDDVDDADNADNGSMGDDVFQERHRASQAAAAGPIPSHPFGHPNAMQTLPTNMPLNTSSYKPGVLDYFESFGLKENDNNAFPLHQPLVIPNYFAPLGHNMQPNGFNPLCVQRQDNFPFLYGAPSFDNSKSSTPALQPINGADYNGFGSAAPFQAGKTRHQDYDI